MEVERDAEHTGKSGLPLGDAKLSPESWKCQAAERRNNLSKVGERGLRRACFSM